MSIFNKLFGGQEREPPEFTAVLEASMENLKFLTANHQAIWHIDQADRWDLNQDIGDLVFTFPHGVVKAPAQIIGSFDTTTSTWLWAWANPSVAEPLMRDALLVLEYGKQHGLARLTTAKWKAEERDGWYMAALANSLCPGTVPIARSRTKLTARDCARFINAHPRSVSIKQSQLFRVGSPHAN
jgi:hypothetical protein